MRLELTRRADYAIRAMLALAGGSVVRSGPSIAAEMDIPPRFVGQVMVPLVKAGLVEARTGRSGGYRLAKPASRITILGIIEAAGDQIRRSECVLRGGACATDGVCAVHEIFASAQESFLARLATATLATAHLELMNSSSAANRAR